EQSVNAQQPSGSSTDAGLTDFLKEIAVAGPKSILPKKSPAPLFDNNKKQYLLIGGGVLGGLLLLAVLAASSKKKNEETVVFTPKAEKSEGKPVKFNGNPASEIRQWMNDVERLPADVQLQAVSTKLRELNHGFDGKIGGMWGGPPEIENGVVRGIGF